MPLTKEIMKENLRKEENFYVNVYTDVEAFELKIGKLVNITNGNVVLESLPLVDKLKDEVVDPGGDIIKIPCKDVEIFEIR